MVEAIEKDILKPLKAERFMCEIKNYFDSAKGTYLYDVCISEHMKKAGISESDYGLWLKKLLEYLTDKYSLRGENILDFGCGTGELTVWMNCLGYNAVGVDIHEQFLKYAKILATENGLSEKIFIHTTDKRLPFPDGSMDIVTMFSVLEHVSDKTLINNVIPELKRICRGIIYVLVPNKLKSADDHTGLWFVPWIPRKLAETYIKLRGEKYKYYISNSGEWDVYYRTWKKIDSIFKSDFIISFSPKELVYPPFDSGQTLSCIGKRIKLGSKYFRLGLPVPVNIIRKLTRLPEEAFYSCFNFILVPKRSE